MTTLDYTVDASTGLAYVQPARNGLRAPQVTGTGHLTYRCHTCGELIPKHWETLFADPVTGWAAYLFPVPIPPTMTTHHDWHLSEDDPWP